MTTTQHIFLWKKIDKKNTHNAFYGENKYPIRMFYGENEKIIPDLSPNAS